jgi:phosphatidylserine/phosphatidylglycerophosphate/cardiolipin synthase-like enzyme/subtilisin family serine protease
VDPALHELIRWASTDELAITIRLDGAVVPPPARLIARFGDVATIRVPGSAVAQLRTQVLSAKAPFRLGAPEEPERHVEDQAPDPTVLPHGRGGRGVLVGVIDWGLDFAHPEFQDDAGRLRIECIWDQRGGPGPLPYGYGAVYRQAELEAALHAEDPYAALGYDPRDSDVEGDGTHGTHVASLAVGRTVGTAPEARLAFVHLTTLSSQPGAALGDSVALLEALDFLARQAGDRPLVINTSMGQTAGPHDGTTLVEQAIDAFVRAGPRRYVVQSCGNYFERNTHAAGRLETGQIRTLTWVIGRGDQTPNVLEVWYPRGDRLQVAIEGPGGIGRVEVPPGDTVPLLIDGQCIGRAYHRLDEPNSGDHNPTFYLYPEAPHGRWRIHLRAEWVVDGHFHAWIERDSGCRPCQSRFAEHDVDPLSTTGTICNGYESIAVGAYGPRGGLPASFSSAGPTRDGRLRPDCLAPGVGVMGARSYRDGSTQPEYVAKSGTSMAAPYVAGIVASMVSVSPSTMSISEVRHLLHAASRPLEEGHDSNRAGYGILDADAAIEAARRGPQKGRVVWSAGEVVDQGLGLDSGPASAPTRRHLPASSGPDVDPDAPSRLERPTLADPVGPAAWARWFDQWVARPSQAPWGVTLPRGPVEVVLPGQVVVRRALGEGLLAERLVIVKAEYREGAWFAEAARADGIQRSLTLTEHGRLSADLCLLPPTEATLETAEDNLPAFVSRGTPPREGNDVSVLVCGEEAWREVYEQIQRARRSVDLCFWALAGDLELVRPPTDAMADPSRRRSHTLYAALFACRQRGVTVRILLWNYPLYATTTFADTLTRLAGAVGTFEVLYQSHPQLVGSWHQKTIVVDDDVAFVSGMNALSNDWDTTDHRPVDLRRAPFAMTAAERRAVALTPDHRLVNPPRHDYMVRVRGPLVFDVRANFVERWNQALADGARYREHCKPMPEQPVAHPGASGTVRGQIVRTLPAYGPVPAGRATIRDTYLRAIARARSYIYIENQYFRSLAIAEALADAMRRNPRLRVLIVVPPDHTTALDPGDRFQIASPSSYWTGRAFDLLKAVNTDFCAFFLQASYLQGGERRYVPVDLHAKLMIVDDDWYTVGSANLNDRSLEMDGELNIVVHHPTAESLRIQVMSQHLNAPCPANMGEATRMWFESATANYHAWQAGREPRSKVFSYSPAGPLLPLLPRLWV